MSSRRGYTSPGVRGLSVLLALMVTAAALLTAACSEEEDNGTGTEELPEITRPGIDSVSVPALWVLGSENQRTITVHLGLTEAEREAVLLRIAPKPRVFLRLAVSDQFNDGITVEVRDDGGTDAGTPTHAFLADNSGDVVPGDFSYSLRMNTLFAAAEGTVEYSILVYSEGEPTQDNDRNLSDLLTSELEVRANQPPEISVFDIPDSLHAGFTTDTLRVTVLDDDPNIAGIVDTVSLDVRIEGVRLRRLLLSPENASSDLWVLEVDSTFAAGRPTNTYLFRLGAIDRFGSRADSVETEVWIENLPPVTSNLVAPDTVVRPLEGENVYAFFLDVTDSQGFGDIEEVFYEVMPPGSSEWVPSEDFQLQDNGAAPDTTAGDGHWAGGFVTVPENSNFGTYMFRFFARDRAGNLSEEIITDIEFVDSPGVEP
ncbi:hypothetical protein GF324_06170 [bacterium]|nr:hypothetical protein [bacterium]